MDDAHLERREPLHPTLFFVLGLCCIVLYASAMEHARMAGRCQSQIQSRRRSADQRHPMGAHLRGCRVRIADTGPIGLARAPESVIAAELRHARGGEIRHHHTPTCPH